jgi:ADP-ribosyl-[dinitrogen reductase] hydrolase
MEPTRRERIEGGLLGLLVGDAVGVPYEFHDPLDLPEAEPPAWGIAGLRDGVRGIPRRWLDALRGRTLVDPLLARLVEKAAS